MRMIDADALKEEICKKYRHFSQRIAISPVFEAIKKAPTLDAVEVVRCKDCKNWGRTWRRHPPDYHYCPFIDYMTSESFYCAKAERRTDELGITN